MTRLCALLLLAALSAVPANALTAAAGKVDITPDLKTERTYMAGFGATGRRPRGVHDPLYARLLVLSDGRKTVALASFDVLGLYRNDVERLRRLSGFDSPDRYLFVAATHTHSGPDTLGLWGPLIGVSGANLRYHKRIEDAVAAELKTLLGQLRQARLTAANAAVDPRGLCRDSRDPAVIDPYLGAIAFKGADGKAIATLVNWSCHPEVLGQDNRLLTADFPGPLCARIEDKTGGACVFFNGPIGGLLTPDVKAHNFYDAYRVGTTVADDALAALAHPTVSSSDPKLAVAVDEPLIPIQNPRYLLFLPGLAYGHDLYDAAGAPLPLWKRYWLPWRHLIFGLPETARPWVRTEVSRLDIGPVRLLGIPGELFPELLVGGYDGRFRFGQPLIKPDNPNPPDLSRAPKPPYLWEQFQAPVRLMVGLANDELGYIVPGYDFQVSPHRLLIPHPPGTHYEETNSVGPSATQILLQALTELAKK